MRKLFFIIVCFAFASDAIAQTRKINPVARQQYDVANGLLNKAKYKECIVQFTKALQTDPGFTECHMGLGIAYTNLKQLKTANEHFTQVLNRFPKDYEAYLLRGLNYYEMGDTATAFRDMDAAVLSKPDYAKGYFNRGVILFTYGFNDEALADLNSAIFYEKKNAEYHFERAMIYEAMGNYRSAMADYDTVITLNPDLFQMKAYNNRASCKKFFKDVMGAIDDYSAILKKYPGNTVVLINRAFARLSIKDGEGACEDFKTAEVLGNSAAKGFLQKYCKDYFDK